VNVCPECSHERVWDVDGELLRQYSNAVRVFGSNIIADFMLKLAERLDGLYATPSHEQPRERGAYEPLTQHVIDGNQGWLRAALPAKYHDFYDKLVAMAGNSILYAEEIQRLRDGQRSSIAFTKEDAAKIVERKARALTEEYCHGDSGPGGYTWTNKEAEWQVILLEELAEEFRNGA
jgi:hypothetical protein